MHIYCSGNKTKYNDKENVKRINEWKNSYKHGSTKVIYCIDTDDYEKNYNHLNEFNKIKKYCDEHDYDLVWFCHEIEEVFLEERVADKEKVKQAAQFRKNNKISEIKMTNLMSEDKYKCRSNILKILDKYLTRK